MQKGEDNIVHTIAFDRQKLQRAKLNYLMQEKELLAIKEALHMWDQYIKNGTTTIVITNYESLQYLNTTKKYSKQLAY
jgi:antitoxin component YwqK of YwqJK toxin-antitoxin module